MKRLLFTGLALVVFAPHGITAQNDATEITTTIQRVSLYSDRARVTRSGSVRLTRGRTRLAVIELPFALSNASVSAGIPGSANAKILSIEVEETHGKRTATKEARKLLATQKDLQAKDVTFRDTLSALQAEESFLNSFSVQQRTNDKGAPIPLSLSPDTWRRTLDFAGNGLTNVRNKRRKLEADRRQLAKEMQALNLEIQKVRSYQTFANKRVVLEVSAERNATETIEVTYALRGASWRPSYDVRVLSASGQLELVTYGVVKQQTGEDWTKVDLTLSTASPQAGATLPELLAWRLGDRQQVATAVATGDYAGDMDAGYAVDGVSVSESLAMTPPATKSERKAKWKKSSRRSRDRRAPSKVTVASPKESAADEAYDNDGWADQKVIVRIEPADVSIITPGAVSDVIGIHSIAQSTPRPQPKRRPVQSYKIKKTSDRVWSLPPGADFEFRNAERTFSYSGRIIYCPTPRLSASGFDYAYKPDRKQTVLSDGREKRIPVANAKFPAELLYEIVAPLDEKAYLRPDPRSAL